MNNILDHVVLEIRNVILNSLNKIPNLENQPIEISIEKPKEENHGDFSTNVAMQLAKTLKKPPIIIAKSIIDNIDFKNTHISKIECAGAGFINFFLSHNWLYEALKQIQTQKQNYGNVNIGNGQTVLVEFVSANPTGPLHMGNARGGALGDLISEVLAKAGYNVTKEFYINDTGNQIENFGLSLEARYIQALKGEDAVTFPEDGYHGEDIVDRVNEYISKFGDNLLNIDSEQRRKSLVNYALNKNLELIKEGLSNYGVDFDVWFSEQSLFDSGEVKKIIDYLTEKELTYSKDDALWFKASEFGCPKDEVLVRSNGTSTYFASDIAYHKNKFADRKFDKVVNLLGSDHHGHAGRMLSAIKSLGLDTSKIDFVIFQLVHLYKNGEKVRMSKRTGKAISLSDLLDEVGKDAARFFFNMKTSGSHLDFDLDLAIKQSNENPVFYVQYAHARICSILRLLAQEEILIPDVSSVDLSLLSQPEEIALIRKLAEYPEEIKISAKTLEPSRITRYVLDLAAVFHTFYNACRVKDVEENLMKARIILIDSTRIVIKNILDLLKISAPEKM